MSPSAKVKTTLISAGVVLVAVAIAFSVRSRSLTENLAWETPENVDSSWRQEQLRKSSLSQPYLSAIAAGQASLEAEDYEAAVNDFTRAINLSPDSTRGYHGRAIARLKTEDYDGAIVDFTRALELDADDARTYTNRGRAYSALGEAEAALEDYNRALALNPDYGDAYFNRASLYFELEDYEQALTDFTETLVAEPESAKAFYNRAMVYLELDRLNSAIADLETAEALFRKQNNFTASEYTLETLKDLDPR